MGAFVFSGHRNKQCWVCVNDEVPDESIMHLKKERCTLVVNAASIALKYLACAIFLDKRSALYQFQTD